ncbi:hypothetical protein QJS10_CPB13g01660 [Acorus calamus]|uniref:Nitroreductase domain-containing protein n=1 Tax=Acorus calamus TaxID=4465 RepID=A0AAV9DII2_ACOCL|nr:hypothetical protein QJS10_CPB13g01660 [Acorus calamus]
MRSKRSTASASGVVGVSEVSASGVVGVSEAAEDEDIASDGSFSLGMIARFEPVLQEKGAWMYPRLFWETGILGQVLYLEAHAVGISATGIGCYFDDAVHEVLGLKGSEFQSLYHFTVGAPVVD